MLARRPRPEATGLNCNLASLMSIYAFETFPAVTQTRHDVSRIHDALRPIAKFVIFTQRDLLCMPPKIEFPE
jgi:hypothetical protein